MAEFWGDMYLFPACGQIRIIRISFFRKYGFIRNTDFDFGQIRTCSNHKFFASYQATYLVESHAVLDGDFSEDAKGYFTKKNVATCF